MSFLPVTITLQRLEHEGFVESRLRAGTRVRIPSPKELSGHYVLREALERHAASLFAHRATQKQRQELTRAATRLDALALRADRVSFVRAHRNFHHRIAEVAGCPTLTQAIEQAHALSAMWFCAMQHVGEREVARHEELAHALVGGPPAAAAVTKGEHIASGRTHALEALKPYFGLRTRSRETFARAAARS